MQVDPVAIALSPRSARAPVSGGHRGGGKRGGGGERGTVEYDRETRALRWGALTKGQLSCLVLSSCGRHLAVCAGGGGSAPKGTSPEILCFDVSAITDAGIEIHTWPRYDNNVVVDDDDEHDEHDEQDGRRTAVWRDRDGKEGSRKVRGRGRGRGHSYSFVGGNARVRLLNGNRWAPHYHCADGVRLESSLSGHVQVRLFYVFLSPFAPSFLSFLSFLSFRIPTTVVSVFFEGNI